MSKERIIKEVFEIAMHSIRNEEIFLKKQAIEKYTKQVKEPITSACAAISYESDILRASESINSRREWLYKLMDDFYKEKNND